jgi:hypothetical protein
MLASIALSRLKPLVITTGVLLALADQAAAQAPRFRADGRDADAFGKQEGYPACAGAAYLGEQRCLIGALSDFDKLFPARVIAAPKAPVPLGRAAGEPSIRYTYAGQSLTLDQYLDAHPVTGFLIAKGDAILVERYQYARTDRQRLTSFSMAKTIVALLIGVAVKDGAIRSIDEPAEAYVPGLKGSEYGRTPIKALLQMSSGVAFSEVYTDPKSDVATLARLTLGQAPGGSLPAVKRFNTRLAPPGQRFYYPLPRRSSSASCCARHAAHHLRPCAREAVGAPGGGGRGNLNMDATGQEVTLRLLQRRAARLGAAGADAAHDGKGGGASCRASGCWPPPRLPQDGHLRLGCRGRLRLPDLAGRGEPPDVCAARLSRAIRNCRSGHQAGARANRRPQRQRPNADGSCSPCGRRSDVAAAMTGASPSYAPNPSRACALSASWDRAVARASRCD